MKGRPAENPPGAPPISGTAVLRVIFCVAAHAGVLHKRGSEGYNFAINRSARVHTRNGKLARML
jgi:hypothetical protein